MIQSYDEFICEKHNIRHSLQLSRKLSDKMKELIKPLLNTGSKIKDGIVKGLRKPHGLGEKMKGVSLGADNRGFFVYTHRAASKRYESPERIPVRIINYIRTTG